MPKLANKAQYAANGLDRKEQLPLVVQKKLVQGKAKVAQDGLGA